MSVIRQVSDGDYSTAWVNGPPSIKYPFKEFGDIATWEWHAKLRMDAMAYRRNLLARYSYNGVQYGANYGELLSYWNTPIGIGQLINPGEPQDVGNGLVEFTVVISPVPVPRIQGQSIVYNIQLTDNSTTPPTISEIQTPVSAAVYFEYGTSMFTPLRAPKYGLIIQGGTTLLQVLGDWGVYQFSPYFGFQFTSLPIGTSFKAGDLVLAQDSTCDIYKGPFYYRRSPFITWPNLRQISTS
jgi:hypothetical protein